MATKFKIYVVRPARDFLLYHIIYSLFSLGRFANRKMLLKWHGSLAVLVYSLTKKTRKAIASNLETAFGPSSDPQVYDNMGKKLFSCLGKTLTDYSLFSKMKTKDQFSKYFTFEGEENLQKAYNRGKGVLCMVVHTRMGILSNYAPYSRLSYSWSQQ